MAELKAPIGGIAERDRFVASLLDWFALHGRHDLPWQRRLRCAKTQAYRTWVSEIMLQQTQVAAVLPYYRVFIRRFPTLSKLASAPLDEVLALWSGLGYYARARNMHRAAVQVMHEHRGRLPVCIDQLIALPGIGRSTGGAILNFAHGQAHPILDGNVRRVLSRYFLVEGNPNSQAVKKQLWALSAHMTPKMRGADYTQAIMDLGALVCTRTRPSCSLCPVGAGCAALRTDRVQQLPQKKSGRTLLTQTWYMLLLRCERSVFLQKRALSGVWGGLYCTPVFSSQGAIDAWCEARQIQIEPLEIWPERYHTLTHFRMRIVPVYSVLLAGAAHLRTEGIWHQSGTQPPGGMAVPVRKLVDIFEQQITERE